MNRVKLAQKLLSTATLAIKIKAEAEAPERNKAICRAVHLKQVSEVEQSLEAALKPFFEQQLKDVAKNLSALDVPLPYEKSEGGANCGTGAGGFKPGNQCARGGGEGSTEISLKEAMERSKNPWTPPDFNFKSYNGNVQRTSEEQDVINKWTFVKNAEKVNDYLKNGDGDEFSINAVRVLDGLFSRSSLPGDVVAYRGIVSSKSYEVGDKIHHVGYSSTTLDDSFAKHHMENIRSGRQTGAGIATIQEGEPILLKILLPKGSRVTTGAQSATELLVDRNSTYRVIKKTKNHLFAVLEQAVGSESTKSFDGSKSSDTSKNLAKVVFNPRDYDKALIQAALPPIARSCVKAAMAQWKVMGVDVRKIQKSIKADGANCGTGAGGFKPGNQCARGGGSGLTLDKADEMWEDYGFASTVRQISKTGTVPTHDAGGSPISKEYEERARDAEKLLQSAAESNKITLANQGPYHWGVFRGEFHEAGTDIKKKFKRHSTVEFDSLTAVATEKSFAEKYLDPQYAGFSGNDDWARGYSGDGKEVPVKVLFNIQAKGPITGYNLKHTGLPEAILPKGSRYKVSAVREIEKNTWVVELYNNGSLKHAFQETAGKSFKASTASEWLNKLDPTVPENDLPDTIFNTPYGSVNVKIATEMPQWMKQQIKKHIEETFQQDYWAKINDTFLKDIQDYLTIGTQEGWSIASMAEKIAQTLGGGDYASWRATNIARTESGNALNGARSLVADGLIGGLGDVGKFIKKVWLSVLGSTTRAAHANLDGVPADENNLWNLNGVLCRWPGDTNLPAGDRCHCFPGSTLVEGSFTGSQRVWYDGTVIELVTKKGVRLTVTPNHPIMTQDGWVPAGMLNPGQKLACHKTKTNIPNTVSTVIEGSGDYVQNKPATIEEIFGAFSVAVGGVKVIRSHMDDFYGDGKFMQGDIEVVRTNWKLLKDGEFHLFEKRGDLVFKLSNVGLTKKFSLGSSDSSLHGNSNTPTSFPGSTKPFVDVLFGSILPSGALTIGETSYWNSEFFKPTPKNTSGEPTNLREFLHRNSGLIEFDELVEVRRNDFSGHVYDLESEYGLIVAKDPTSVNTDMGIIASNCQCTVVVEFGMDNATAQQLIQDYEQRVIAQEKAYRIEEFKKDRSYSCLMLEIPEPLAEKIMQLGQDWIPDDALSEEGREDWPHITIKYGIHTEDAEEILKDIQDEGPIKFTIGKISKFEGETQDVIKMDVESDTLKRLRKIVEEHPNTDEHPDYNPHITIAYVKKGKIVYQGPTELTDKEFEGNILVFSSKNETKTRLILKGGPGSGPRPGQGRKPEAVEEYPKKHLSAMSDETKTSMRKWLMDMSDSDMEFFQSQWTNQSRRVSDSWSSGKPDAEAKRVVDMISQAPSFEGVAYRGIMFKGEGHRSDDFLKSIESAGIGAEWSTNAPISMTRSSDTGLKYASGYVVLRVKSKTARAIEDISDYDDEYEVVGLPGTKYKVTGIQRKVKAGDGAFEALIDLEEL